MVWLDYISKWQKTKSLEEAVYKEYDQRHLCDFYMCFDFAIFSMIIDFPRQLQTVGSTEPVVSFIDMLI